MGRYNIIGTVFGTLMIMLVQILLLKDIVLFNEAFCFAYILILLLVPIETSPSIQIGIGFILGLVMDLFYFTYGVHATACTMLMFLRPFWISNMTPSGGYDVGIRVNVKNQGLQWFVSYAFPLLLIHSLMLFFVEAASFGFFWNTLMKSFFSAIFSLIVILIIQYLFYKKMR